MNRQLENLQGWIERITFINEDKGYAVAKEVAAEYAKSHYRFNSHGQTAVPCEAGIPRGLASPKSMTG